MVGYQYLVITTTTEEFLLGVWAREGDGPVLRWAGREWVTTDEEWGAITPRVRKTTWEGCYSAIWDAAELAAGLPGIPDPDEGRWMPTPYFPAHLQVRVRPWVSLPPSHDPQVDRDETEDFIKRILDHDDLKGEAFALSSMRTCGGMAPYDPAQPDDRDPAWTRSEARQQSAWAETIAEEAHRGQTDRVGAPYITHPMRVAGRFDPVEQPIEHCAGWLHDVIEDTDWTPALLRDAGIRRDVIDTVLLLTRDGDPDYYERIRRDPHARAVKLADIDDNLDPARTALLDEDTRMRLQEKYTAARKALGV